ncbi:hypothetical protein CR513_52646, partial [Mucuna pruriens]
MELTAQVVKTTYRLLEGDDSVKGRISIVKLFPSTHYRVHVFFEMSVHDDSHQDDDDDKSSKKTKKTSYLHTELRQDCDKAKTDDDEGGHKSIHHRAQRKEKRDFPSKHSLFGHMAWHSDRNWKGIHPPLSSPSHHEPTSFSIAEERVYSEDKINKHKIIAAQTLMALSRDTWPSCEYPQLPSQERSKKNINGASNSTRIEDIPSTSGVKDHANATDLFKKKRKLIVILRNPYLESKDEKRDPYKR